MKTIYLAEENGNLLTLTGEMAPLWFVGGSIWHPTPREAARVTRMKLIDDVEQTRSRHLEAIDDLNRFEMFLATQLRTEANQS